MARNLLALVEIGEKFVIGNEGIGAKKDYESIGSFISAILPNVYIISGIVLFFLFILGGFSIITAGGSPEKVEQGQKTIFGAIAGFVIVFASFWIIQIIEYITGIKISNL